ncbi:MAG: DUF4097 family beta strand repeat-containing protein [bacterium]|nr:DUF4097 family beta strand repeat-containing protein [bacterium]
MSKKTKTWIIIASCFVLIGSIIFGGVMAILKWDFTRLSTNKYETNKHEISEGFKAISINTDTADIVFVPSENAENAVECYEQKNLKHSVAVKDDTLIIEKVDTRKWYEHIGVFFETPKITVYIPQGEYGSISVKSSTGDVEIPKEFRFESVDISQSTGDVTSYASVSDVVKIKTSTGNIRVENISAGALDLSVSTGQIMISDVICKGNVNISVSTGKTKLTDVECENVTSSGSTGNIMLKNVIAAEKFTIKRSTGDVRFEGSDACEIFIETDTGDVTGSFLTDKVFITQTDTGRVDVPKTVTGGRCEITTDTGDIRINILNQIS